MGQAKYGCRMPLWLGSPMQMLWWETDEVIVIMTCLSAAVLVGGWAWLALLVGPFGYIRLKKAYPRGYLKHMLYFAGVAKFDGYPSHFEKKFSE